MTTTISDVIDRLTKKRRGKGLLGPAAQRDGLPISTAIAYPAGAEAAVGSTGIASPLTEQEPPNTNTYTLTSSDGLFVFEFATTSRYLDASSAELVVIHRDPEEQPAP